MLPEIESLGVEVSPEEEEAAPPEVAPPSSAITVVCVPVGLTPPSATEMDSVALPAASAESASPETKPVPGSERHAFSFPPRPVAPSAAETEFWIRSAPQDSPRPSWRRKVSLGLLAAGLGVAATFGVGSALSLRAPDAGATAAVAPAVPAPVAAPLAVAAPLPAVAPLPAFEAAAPPLKADSSASPKGTPSDLHLEKLGDGQLVAAFALEQRRDVPACSERLGAGADGYEGNQPHTSRAHFNAARRALLRGERDAAYTELCIATAHDVDNVDAQRNLAELALDLGDPARAKEAAERGLSRAPKSAELLGVLGDALAMLGEVPESRRTWLETLEAKGSEAERVQRLAASYQKAGERSQSSFDFARARSYFRRALILTDGGYEAGLGLADALLWLEQPHAGLVWAERAARGLPASARAQILLGDAYAKTGALDSAREAWQAARRAEPGNGIAARRLSRGPR